MTTLLLLVLALLDGILPEQGTMTCSPLPSTPALLKLMEGRARLFLVNKGLTEEEVVSWMGEPFSRFVHCNYRCQDFRYHDFGVEICFTDGRVSSIGVFRLQLAANRVKPAS